MSVYSDSDEHVQLVLRTLGVDEASWSQTLDRYCQLVDPTADVEARLTALGKAFEGAAPLAATTPESASASCSSCDQLTVTPAIAKRATPTLVYGRCTHCGHGVRLAGPALNDVYQSEDYYRKRSADGTGYEAYAAERAYREAKGTRLLDALAGQLATPPRSLLEVGSGFGYTLAAAAKRGWQTQGVDVNPAAERAAHDVYGLKTANCTLEQALATGRVPPASWDVVLYQFVLEHLVEPRRELCTAAQALAPGGTLVLVVPSMTTFELSVFGSAYRSLRADHLHLFSARSIACELAAAGLELTSLHSHCSLHLLGGFLEPSQLRQLYAAGRGPDLTVLARRHAA